MRIEAKRPRATGDEARARLRIAAREERDVVPERDEFLGEIRHDAFGAAIELGRDAFV
jgi:hypothetical protein